jgi:DNA-3-methyladenine glycosylase II
MVQIDQEISIVPSGPFSWERALDMLRGWAPVRRHGRGDDALTRLAFPLDGDHTPVAVALRFEDGALRCAVAGTDRTDAVARQVARTFSLDHDATGYPAVGGRDPELGRLMAALPGFRPVCFTSPYEAAAWAVISPRIGKDRAAEVNERLVAEHGHALKVAGAEVRAFPEPERLLRLEHVPGLSAEKLRRLHGVARAALDGRLDAERLRALGDEAAPASLRAIPGIGEFWSSGIYLRACGIADVFPAEPLSVAALGHLHGLGDRPSPDQLAMLTDRLRPYRMWAAVLLRVASGRGLVPGVAGRERQIRSAAG